MANTKHKPLTIRALSSAAKCSTETVHRVLKENPDAPRHDASAFAEYIAQTRVAKAEKATLAEQINIEKLRKLRADADKSEEAVKIMRGQYVQVSEVTSRLAPLIAEWQRNMEDKARAFAAWGAGRSKAELQNRLLSDLNEVAAMMRGGIAGVAAEAESSSKAALATEGAAAPRAPGAGRPKKATGSTSTATKRKAGKKVLAKK